MRKSIKMTRRIFAVIICLPILMLCSCKPGDPCGPGKILDCTGNCLKSSFLYGSLGDGICDENLNCSEFNYDGGDCKGTNSTTTTTIEETTSTTTTEGEDFGITMTDIPGGTFEMGCSPGDSECNDSETPRHTVTISAFKMSAYEITQGQWEAVMGSNPSHFSSCGDDCPVESVSWNAVQVFIDELNSLTSKNYRLPTEAEWEYAVRAGTTAKYYCGDDESYLGDIAWYNYNSEGQTHLVGQEDPNAWGLYDMSGNVWEWCSDWYYEDYYSSSPDTDPQGPDSGSKRVIRGGSWMGPAMWCRSSVRGSLPPLDPYTHTGFRLCQP